MRQLRPKESLIIMKMEKGKDYSVLDLIKEVGASSSMITYYFTDLERDGIVKRTQQNTRGLPVSYSLTEKGVKIMEALKKVSSI